MAMTRLLDYTKASQNCVMQIRLITLPFAFFGLLCPEYCSLVVNTFTVAILAQGKQSG